MRIALLISATLLLASCSPAYADPTPAGGGVRNPLTTPLCATSSNIAPYRLLYDEQVRWSSGSCSSSTYAYMLYNSSTGRFQIQNSSGLAPGLDVGGCSFASTSTGSATCATFMRTGKVFQSDGETSAVLQTNAPISGSGGLLEYDTTNGKWRAYEGTNWNFVITGNPDAGSPWVDAPSAIATQVDAFPAVTGFIVASDRDPYGKKLMRGNGVRPTQLGGGLQWALEQRTLTINPFMEQTTCPRCTECSGSTLSAMDGQTCTGGTAGTAVIDAVDFRTLTTTAVANNTESWTSRVAETRRNKFPHMVWQGYVTANTSERVWYGLTGVTLSGADLPVGNLAAFRFSTNVPDTNWQACTGDGATTTCTDTGVSVLANRSYMLEIDCRDSAASKCLFSVIAQHTGTLKTVSKTTNLPAAAGNMFPRHYCETLTTATKTCGIGPSVLETL